MVKDRSLPSVSCKVQNERALGGRWIGVECEKMMTMTTSLCRELSI